MKLGKETATCYSDMASMNRTCDQNLVILASWGRYNCKRMKVSVEALRHRCHVLKWGVRSSLCKICRVLSKSNYMAFQSLTLIKSTLNLKTRDMRWGLFCRSNLCAAWSSHPKSIRGRECVNGSLGLDVGHPQEKAGMCYLTYFPKRVIWMSDQMNKTARVGTRFPGSEEE